jgi:predicted outer membrane repeat protein
MFNRVKKTILVLSFFLLIVFGKETASGLVIYVDEHANGLNNGSSWQNAFNDLQYALILSLDGDEIHVAHGVYTPYRGVIQNPDGSDTRSRSASFRIFNDITLLGGFAGIRGTIPDERNFEKYKTILSGDLNGNDLDVNNPDDLISDTNRAENSYHVVTLNITNITVTLDGFIIKGGNANGSDDSRQSGAGIYNTETSLTIRNCIFTANTSLKNGGGLYDYQSDLNLADCNFVVNDANNGGGIFSDGSNLNLDNCSFISNSVNNSGGGMYSKPYIYDNREIPSPLHTTRKDVVLNKCKFIGNSANNSGGGMYIIDTTIFMSTSEVNRDIINCIFIDNTAGSGGGIYKNNETLYIKNSLFMSNSADSGGGIYGTANITNCTSVWDSADKGAFIYSPSNSMLSNCIAWYIDNPLNIPPTTWPTRTSPSSAVNYSNIQGGWSGGNGNINTDPLFLDPLGPDNIAGTGDEDLRLAPLSPCVNSGDPSYKAEPNEADLDGNPRVFGGRVDMGAYEFDGKIYVDDDAPYNPSNDTLTENGTRERPFNTIQKAIDYSKDGYKVLVLPGLYSKINFKGKKITVSGTEGAAVIEAVPDNLSDSLLQDAVTFHTGEGANSILKNFVIKNSGLAVSLDYGSCPTIQNITFVDNVFGIGAYEDTKPDVSNCIFFNNSNGDIFGGCIIRYSCLKGAASGVGNFYANPLFVDYTNGDYHLKSQGWRWSESSESWTWDEITSPCIDTGDPCSPLGDEPLSVPRDPYNMYGLNKRINMGAYGGSSQASLPPLGWNPAGIDTTPPSPDPAQWSSDGSPKEVQKGNIPNAFWVEMEAQIATDDSGVVEYYFECTTNPNFSSSWQRSPTYKVYLDRTWQDLSFRVKARDHYLNETEWSEEVMAQ